MVLAKQPNERVCYIYDNKLPLVVCSVQYRKENRINFARAKILSVCQLMKAVAGQSKLKKKSCVCVLCVPIKLMTAINLIHRAIRRVLAAAYYIYALLLARNHMPGNNAITCENIIKNKQWRPVSFLGRESSTFNQTQSTYRR